MSTTTAAVPSSPSATSGHVHGPVRLLRPPRRALHRQCPGMYTGQFIYCDHHTTLSIGNIPPHRRTFEGTIIYNVEHRTDKYGAPLPGHSGTMPSSLAPNPTTALGQKAPPAKGRPRPMAVKSTTLIALRRLFSSGSGDPSSAQANRAISSTLDKLQLDIALRNHERTCEFFSPWHYPLLLRNRYIRGKGRRRGGGSKAGEEVR